MRYFFVAMALVLLVVAFAGFGRTFYFNAFSDAPALPWYLVVHGVFLTAWFALLLTQALLIATARPALHRRLGRWGIALGGIVAATTFVLIFGAEASREARGATGGLPIAMLVLGDFAMLFAFAALATIGVLKRSQPALHKRAMLLASIALMVPGVARLPRVPVLAELGPALVTVVILSLLLANWVHDIVVYRRLQATTIGGSALIVGGFLVASAIAGTEAGETFVAAISFGGD